jgi:hypothetical protein
MGSAAESIKEGLMPECSDTARRSGTTGGEPVRGPNGCDPGGLAVEGGRV